MKGIDSLIHNSVFASTEEAREQHRREIRRLAASQGAYPASIQGLYTAAGKGLYTGKTVPAIGIRGMTYQVARMVFKAAVRHKVGAFIFDIACSEIAYTKQRPAEFAACVLAAAVKEAFRGPVFLQGHHFKVNPKRYASDAEKELAGIIELIRESVAAGFLNIQLDASTLSEIEGLAPGEEKNCAVTAGVTSLIRGTEPAGMTVSVGGEIGDIASRNSRADDVRAFMGGYLSRLAPGTPGISKISVQTKVGQKEVALRDGSTARVKIDFEALEETSRVARAEFGMAGAVQHGNSTLPDEALDVFPSKGVAEIHLATGFQNVIFDSRSFPQELLGRIDRHLLERYADERKPKDTQEQFLRKARKHAFGDFKEDLWGLSGGNLEGIGQELEANFSLVFQKLGVVDTTALVQRFTANATS